MGGIANKNALSRIKREVNMFLHFVHIFQNCTVQVRHFLKIAQVIRNVHILDIKFWGKYVLFKFCFNYFFAEKFWSFLKKLMVKFVHANSLSKLWF